MILGHYGVAIPKEQLVSLPEITSLSELKNQFTFAELSGIGTLSVVKIALVMAIVASIETLLSVEATDKLDPQKKVTPANRELKAQGLGNILSGLIGGLPITQVVVRSSANITFGAKTMLSAILHGGFSADQHDDHHPPSEPDTTGFSCRDFDRSGVQTGKAEHVCLDVPQGMGAVHTL